MSNNSPKYFSIIVPVFNGADTISNCLNALLNQDYPIECFEIIVINDGSYDDTQFLAEQYPVRIIKLSENRGRIEARVRGALEARHETLIFIDVRVTPERDFLSNICKYDYLPIIPNVIDYDGSNFGFSRFFFLLRCKLYSPYYPLSRDKGDYFITHENFNQAPKGTTCFICDRELWLSCQPLSSNKFTSDDTLILSNIVTKKPILRICDASVEYKQRTNLFSVLLHTFERGPRFADFYLKPGGKYFPTYVILWILVLFAIIYTIYDLYYGLLIFLFTLLIIITGSSLFLYRKLTDVAVVYIIFPLILFAFGAGIFKWQLLQLFSFNRRINSIATKS